MAPTDGSAVSPPRWHLQDWLICIEALVTLTDPEATTPSERRAWQLIETIAAAFEIDPTAYIFEIDDSWGPQTAVEGSTNAPQPAALFESDDWALLETALAEFADTQQHTKRGQRACQLAAAIDTDEQLPLDH